MDELTSSLDAARHYPKNLICHTTHQHVLDSYVDRLQERGDNLFCSPDNAVVNFWQFDHEAQSMSSTKLKNERLGLANAPTNSGFRFLAQVCPQFHRTV
jgi:hypothetical protein